MTIVVQAPEWLCDKLDVMGQNLVDVMNASTAAGAEGPGIVVNHVMVVLMRLLAPVNPDTLPLLHSVLDLAAQQYKSEQN